MTPDIETLLLEIVKLTEQGKLEWRLVSDNNNQLSIGENAVVLEYERLYRIAKRTAGQKRFGSGYMIGQGRQ